MALLVIQQQLLLILLLLLLLLRPVLGLLLACIQDPDPCIFLEPKIL
jgi:hypothetical protein